MLEWLLTCFFVILIVFTMCALCCIAMMGVRDVRKYGWSAAPNLFGFLCLWLALESIGAVALTWMLLPEPLWLETREYLKVVAIAGETAFAALAAASHFLHQAADRCFAAMLAD